MNLRRPPRTASIGGATFDLFVRTDRSLLKEGSDGKILALPMGAKIRVDEVIETCGGGASNTSVGLSRLGYKAAFCGIVGCDQWGERLIANMQREGVDTKGATIVEGETSSSSIILSVKSGERVILYNAGTNVHLHDATFDKERIKASNWIYLNHLPAGGSVIHDDLVEILSTTSARFTWNPGGYQIERGMNEPNQKKLLEHTDILLLNKEEALAFSKTKDIEEALASFRSAKVRITCVTDGKEGATACEGEKIYHCPTLRDAVILDTTGAGDAFGTGLTWAIIYGMDLPEALRAGTINATNVLRTIGAQSGLLTDIEMRRQLSSVQLDVEVRSS